MILVLTRKGHYPKLPLMVESRAGKSRYARIGAHHVRACACISREPRYCAPNVDLKKAV
jgi:hypothetical protein